MKNFDFLKNVREFEPLYRYCDTAETYQLCDPEKSAVASRRALEYLVKLIYTVKGWDIPERASLFSLVDDYDFKAFIGSDDLMMRIHYIRKCGNNAAHDSVGSRVGKRQAFFALLNLHVFVGTILQRMGVIVRFAPFDNALIPATPSPTLQAPEKPEAIPAETAAKYEGKLDESIAAEASRTLATEDAISEAETRRLYIDLMLEESGWAIEHTEGAKMRSKACVEIEVTGMPNAEGKGYADYVLFDASCKPLAVIEAKRTTKNVEVGRNQAMLYADCLEQEYGVRPVVYYTNGFQTKVIDGLGYPDREVYDFHTEQDLELLIQKRSRQDITDLAVDTAIAGRHYQISAIHAVCEHLNKRFRRALLVMATGTGKTRVSIALTELLMRNNWAKNILFLADRTTLVNQAARNFAKLMPSVSSCTLSDDRTQDKDKDLSARLMFSTYQTMVNYIDDSKRPFSIGRFDLIIVDEAHRSVFGKYGSIFDYFDSLLIGLTATPRDEVDRSTYDLFGLEQGIPTYAYELQEAVDDHFLVNFRGFTRETNLLSNGIRYDDLSPEEKEQLEDVWRYEKAKKLLDPNSVYTRDIESRELFEYIYNIDTVDKVLTDLMEHGLKVDDGDCIGKTIIFAHRHEHAELIVQRFRVLYPQFGSDFCTVIDNYAPYAQNLLDNFSEPRETAKRKIQIAVSVDMLDTGVDVPEVLNLVFFKQVKSKIKFWQMVGRGTRLCPDIFGAGKDKQEFYIFDWCGNLEFFGQNPNGAEGTRTIGLAERLFNARLEIAVILQHVDYQTDEFARSFHDELKDILCAQIGELETARIAVRKQWALVEKYKVRDNWQYVSEVDAVMIKSNLAPLLINAQTDLSARRFDFIVLQKQLSLINPEVKGAKAENKIILIGKALEGKASIPQVMAKIDTIRMVQTPVFWENVNLERLEHVRKELREIVQYLMGDGNKSFTVDISDVVTDEGETELIITQMSYKQRVMDYLAENTDNPVLQKIQTVEQLTQLDIRELERIFWQELGTKEDYERTYLHQDRYKLYGGNIAAFLRTIIGVDMNIALDKFVELIQGQHLTSMQEEYLRNIIRYVCENGDIERRTMQTDPFRLYDCLDLFGNKAQAVPQYIDRLHKVITAEDENNKMIG